MTDLSSLEDQYAACLTADWYDVAAFVSLEALVVLEEAATSDHIAKRGVWQSRLQYVADMRDETSNGGLYPN